MAFTPKTFPRIVNYADGWLGIAGFGPLEQMVQLINGLEVEVKKFNKEPSGVSVYILAYPIVLDSTSPSTQKRLPMTGNIEQIRSDIEQIKKMGVKHIVFGYLFSPIGKNMKTMIEVTKQLAVFCR